MLLPNFSKELERSKGGLDYHQVWRYTRAGKMPRILVWLAEHPNLVDALREDAQAIQHLKDNENARTTNH